MILFMDLKSEVWSHVKYQTLKDIKLPLHMTL